MAREYVQKVVSLGEVPYSEKVIYYDDFSRNFRWSTGGVGTDYRIYVFGEQFVGPCSLRMLTRSTSPAAGDYVYIAKNIPLRPSRVVSVDITFDFSSETNVDSVRFRLSRFDGSTEHRAQIEYHPPEAAWYYVDENGTAQPIPGGAQSLHHQSWHRCKFTVDFVNDEFVSLVSDSLEVDMNGLKLYTPSSTTKEALTLYVYLYNETATKVWSLIDNIQILEE